MGRRKLSGMKRFEITCSWEEDPLIVKRGILDFFKTSSKNMEGLDLYRVGLNLKKLGGWKMKPYV